MRSVTRLTMLHLPVAEPLLGCWLDAYSAAKALALWPRKDAIRKQVEYVTQHVDEQDFNRMSFADQTEYIRSFSNLLRDYIEECRP